MKEKKTIQNVIQQYLLDEESVRLLEEQAAKIERLKEQVADLKSEAKLWQNRLDEAITLIPDNSVKAKTEKESNDCW